MKQPSVDVSIIIVNFNTKELTIAAIESLARAWRQTDRWEVIVVDNGSDDGSASAIGEFLKKPGRFFACVSVVTSENNLGFAGGNNRGIAVSRGRYVLLLNSDTEVQKNSVSAVASFLDSHPKAGVATCKLLLADGSMDPACHRGFPTPWVSLVYFCGFERLFPRSRLFGGYHMGYADMARSHQIDSPSGAFYMVRREALASVGPLDEDYFMYGEDLDWSYRMKAKGWEIWFVPQVTALHRKKQSGRAHGNPALRKQTQQYFYETMLLFYQKHFARNYPRWVTVLIQQAVRLRVWLLHSFSL